MPTPTDLVTDLPADFEVFGQAVDTDFADLLGGTTGQILSKASATDLDFTWITNDIGDITAVTVTAPITGGGTSGSVGIAISGATTSASGAVQLSDSTSTTSSVLASTPTATKAAYDLAAAATPKSTFTAKGSIAAATAASTPANLTVGNNGEALVADSSTATGLRYTAGNPMPNPVINSCMDIAQRGTSFTATTGYVLDRWYYSQFGGGGGITITQQATADTTNLPNIQYSMRIQRNSGSTTTNAPQIAQSVENANAVPLAGKAITFSFYARAGANYSAASSNLNYQLRTGTGTDQNTLTSGFTGSVNLLDAAVAISTTWTRYSFTATVGATAKQIAPYFYYSPSGTAGVNDWVEITGVQIDIGSVALPIRRTGSSIGGELAACQRYYFRIGGLSNYMILGSGTAESTTKVDIQVATPTTMRTLPTAVDFSTIGVQPFPTGTITAVTAAVLATVKGVGPLDVELAVASGLTQGVWYRGTTNNSTSGYLGFSAEL